MRRIILILTLFISIQSFAQTPTGYQKRIVNERIQGSLMVDSAFNIPRYYDTTAANLHKRSDTCGAMFFAYGIDSLYYRACNPKRWVSIGSGSGGGGGSVDSVVLHNDSLKYYVAATGTFITQKSRFDSIVLNEFFIPDHSVDTLFALVSSIEAGQNASPTDSAYMYRLADYYGLEIGNPSAAGYGSFFAAKLHNQQVNPGNNYLSVIQPSFNDLRAGGYWTTGSYRTYRKIMNSMKDIFSNQFLKSYVTAGGASVTRYGSWTVLDFSSAGAKTTNGAYTQTVNDSITYVFTDSTVIVQYITADGIAQNYATFDVYIDNVLQGSYSENDQTDGFTDGTYNNQNNPAAIIITGLTYASHKIKLVKTDANARPFAVDILGHLVDSRLGKQLIFVKPFKLNATGYAVVAANGSALYTTAISNAVGTSMDSLILTFPVAYQPLVSAVSADALFVPATDLSADSLHPNNQGHRHIAEAIEGLIPTILPSLPDGTIIFNGSDYYGSRNDSLLKVIFENEIIPLEDVVTISGIQTITGQKTLSKPLIINVGELADGLKINNTTSELATVNLSFSGTPFFSFGAAGASSPSFPNETFIVAGQSRDLNFYGNTTKNFVMTNGGHFTMKDVSAPSTPASGYGSTYVRADSLRFKNDGGTEFTLGAGSGFTNLTSFVSQNNWKTFYSDGSGDVQELSNGATHTFLRSAGTSAAPAWYLPTHSKGVTLESPTSSENFGLWQTQVDITITSINAVVIGSSPSVTINIAFGSDITSLTNVFSSGTAITNTTTGQTINSGFNDATIPAGSWIRLKSTASSGTITQIEVTINYTED